MMVLVAATNAEPDPTILQTLPNDVVHTIFQHVDPISQVQLAFDQSSVDLSKVSSRSSAQPHGRSI